MHQAGFEPIISAGERPQTYALDRAATGTGNNNNNNNNNNMLSSGVFCKLRYDTIPVKSASANVSFYTNN